LNKNEQNRQANARYSDIPRDIGPVKELWLCVGRIVRSKFELIPQTTVVLYLGSGIGHGGAQTFDDVCKTSTL
jgi:hypothetical protein